MLFLQMLIISNLFNRCSCDNSCYTICLGYTSIDHKALEEGIMCTWIVEKVSIDGSGKGQQGWIDVDQAYVNYDHPTHARYDHSLNIDFVNTKGGPSSRIAVELSAESARGLVSAILTALETGEREHGLEGAGDLVKAVGL